MKKPSLSDALAQKVPVAPQPAPSPVVTPVTAAKPKDGRVVTTLRIEPERLEALKIIAARKRGKVNDLILEGVAHILALHDMKA
jgi:hypothetical protein